MLVLGRIKLLKLIFSNEFYNKKYSGSFGGGGVR